MDIFRNFSGSESQEGDKTRVVESDHRSFGPFRAWDNFVKCPRPLKRKASHLEDDCDDETMRSTLDTNKRTQAEFSVATPPETPAVARKEYFESQPDLSDKMDQVVEVIESQLGLEILLKHDELRLINQELAKCQVALEQLRRCHLMPYPTNCPTPEQMLDIVEGKGPAVQTRHGKPAPQWAAPFGVVDGPYARHYAKWLIPDPKFDGASPDSQEIATTTTNTAEGRTTRNSFAEGTIGKRVSRGVAGQKLQALPAGYPQPKDKTSPCVLKRAADGLTVKLVCLDCDRGNFSSTQGFINHCRIAHKREFKSHEEAAIACGRPIDVDEATGLVGEEKPSHGPDAGLAHPLARAEAMTESEAYASLYNRIQVSRSLYNQGNLPGVSLAPSANDKEPSKSFVGASATPHLTKLMHGRKFNLNLNEHVEDAKVKTDWDELFSPYGDYEDNEATTKVPNKVSAVARVPAMRVPASTISTPPPPAPGAHPSSSKGRSPHPIVGAHAPFVPSASMSAVRDEDDDVMDVDLSPIPSVSNNAPSLVSDDGEYDDSDDDGVSSPGSGAEAESVSDITEVNIEEDIEVPDHLGAREIPHHRGSTSAGKVEPKHVTFVGTVDGNNKRKRKHRSP